MESNEKGSGILALIGLFVVTTVATAAVVYLLDDETKREEKKKKARQIFTVIKGGKG